MPVKIVTIAILAIVFSSISVKALNDAAAAQFNLLDFRLSNTGDKARIVLEFDQPARFHIFTLDNPFRLVVDIPELAWSEGTDLQLAQPGLVANYRYGLFKGSTMRIVLDLNRSFRVDKYATLAGLHSQQPDNRLYIDLIASDFVSQSFKSDNWQPSPTTIAVVEQPSVAPAATPAGKRAIVIDPGHGGIDPGGIAAGDIYEKDLVLKFARIISKRLTETGKYQVYLTRDDDSYIPLRDRFRFAEQQAADLFISLHADKLNEKNIRGIAVYTLSNRASDLESQQLAQSENRSDIISGHALDHYSDEVSSILIDLAQDSNNRSSWRLAEQLIASIENKHPLLKNPHRYAGFAVLKSPNVPSILIELGFMSNPNDVQALISDEYPEKLARILIATFNKYFNVE